MLTLRPTASLAKRMKEKLSVEAPPSSTVLGDWYAIDFVLAKKQYILCVSEKTRLPVILPAAPYANFPSRLPEEAAEVLRKIGISRALIEKELEQMSPVSLAKTSSKSVLGTLNECRYLLQAHYRYRRSTLDTPLAMALYLADVPTSVHKYETAKEVTLAAFGQPSSRRRLSIVH